MDFSRVTRMILDPSKFPALIEEASKCHCIQLGLDPDEIVDAAALTRQPEGTPPQMVPRWQLHQQGALQYFRNNLSLQWAFQQAITKITT